MARLNNRNLVKKSTDTCKRTNKYSQIVTLHRVDNGEILKENIAVDDQSGTAQQKRVGEGHNVPVIAVAE